MKQVIEASSLADSELASVSLPFSMPSSLPTGKSFWSWVLTLLFATCSSFAQTEVPVDMAVEAHCRLLLQNSYVRVFSIVIPPHEQTYITHASNFLTVALRDNQIVMWNAGEAPIFSFQFKAGDVRFFPGGIARGMRNDSGEEYRNVTVEFRNAGVTTYGYHYYTGQWEDGSTGLSPPVDPSASFVNGLALGMAEAKDVQLLPGGEFASPNPGVEELLIAVTRLELRLNGSNLQHANGEVEWIGARKASLFNSATRAARFVLIQFK